MLLEKIQADIVLAMKSKAEARLETLRGVLAQLKNKMIEKRADLTEEEVVQLLRKEVKKRQEAIGLYQQGLRPDLAAKEQAEIATIEEYLPKALSLEELTAKVRAIIADQNLGDQPFGQQMKAVMAELGGAVDGSMVSQILKQG
ncbi:MAG: GatB/YqeY domain-containing protein [Candidatus Komeilibacteria bacterium]|nr:GatB/YqeY domain-containing protein [Candidatus Komeilibacteria bacterium]